MSDKRILAFCLILLLSVSTVFLAGCSKGPEKIDPNKEGTYETPPFRDSKFHKKKAEGKHGVKLDLSAVDEGYVAVKAKGKRDLKFQVVKGKVTYTYDLRNGEPSVFPLQCGDGKYRFLVLENVSGNRYAEMYADSAKVTLKDEYQPFLRPSDYVSYGKKSACVKKASELASHADTDTEVVQLVFDYICENVSYDKEKAETAESGYLPDPDETMNTGKGICFDYASLTAAMLRSQGIPTKVIFGYVSPDDVYHAWNMIYIKNKGWVTVGYEVKENDWNRVDLTFSAGGADSDFVGDGSHYADVFTY